MKEMYHGRDCRECRTKYLKVKRHERERKTCPVCKLEHNIDNCDECSDKCKILNRHKKVNGCWEWQGKLNNSGYGCYTKRINKEKTEVRAHRRSYEIFKGEIPEGMLVCHTCDNPSCCNPDHLWLGTPKENTQDCIKKGRFLNAKKRAVSAGKMTEETVIEIRRLHTEGMKSKDLEEKFNISQSNVSSIVNYKIWKHVDE